MLISNSFGQNLLVDKKKNDNPPRINLRAAMESDCFISFGSGSKKDLSLKGVLDSYYDIIPERVRVLAEAKVKDGIDDSLWNVQKEAYSGLNNMDELKMFKLKYPEFSDVQSAVDVLNLAEDKSKGRNRPHFVSEGPKKSLIYSLKDDECKGIRLLDGSVKDFTLENFHYEMLRLLYAENYSIKELASLFQIQPKPMYLLLAKHLNIPMVSKEYGTIRLCTNEQKFEEKKLNEQILLQVIPMNKDRQLAKILVRLIKLNQMKKKRYFVRRCVRCL